MAVPVRATGIHVRHGRFTETTINQTACATPAPNVVSNSNGQRPTHSDHRSIPPSLPATNCRTVAPWPIRKMNAITIATSDGAACEEPRLLGLSVSTARTRGAPRRREAKRPNRQRTGFCFPSLNVSAHVAVTRNRYLRLDVARRSHSTVCSPRFLAGLPVGIRNEIYRGIPGGILHCGGCRHATGTGGSNSDRLPRLLVSLRCDHRLMAATPLGVPGDARAARLGGVARPYVSWARTTSCALHPTPSLAIKRSLL